MWGKDSDKNLTYLLVWYQYSPEQNPTLVPSVNYKYCNFKLMYTTCFKNKTWKNDTNEKEKWNKTQQREILDITS